ncbi:MAG TPA: Ig-like domain-containing protein, partial [Pyrinomonadaceae bacterium]|nr:Ig-like domain-containing protein [Pyrinomonadaceae bacterium]
MTRSTFRFRSRTSKALAAGLLLLAACGALASPLSPAPLRRALPFLAFAERHDAAPATPATADAKAAPAVQENRLGNSLAPAAASAALVAPNVTATKTDAFSAPFAEPGEEINYTVTVTNNGSSDAEGVQFNDTPDPNTTLVPGSIQTTVVAVNNTYASIGNVGISVDANNGLLANDSDPDGDVLTASAAATTAQGGDLSVNTDGGFSYSPAPGFEGTDSFTYTVTDVDGNTDSGVVTIAVSGMIWFVNPSAPSGGDGRLTTPFNALTGPGSFDASAADEPGDNIFLYSGTHTGGLLLKSSQRLVGAAAPASLDTIAGVVVPAFSNPLPSTGGASPVIASAGDGLVLGSNNALWGFTVGNSTGADIIGSGFGTLVVRGVQISGTGQAVNLDNGTLDAQFGTVEVTNRTTTGLFMNNVGGTADFGATSIDNALNVGGYGIRIENSSAAVAFASADISNSNVTVPQTDTDSNGLPDSEGDGDAIFLTNNTGSFSLNGGSLTGCGNDCIDVRNSQNLT